MAIFGQLVSASAPNMRASGFDDETPGFPKALQLVFTHFRNPSIPSPSSALRFSQNADPVAGDRGIKVEKVGFLTFQVKVSA